MNTFIPRSRVFATLLLAGSIGLATTARAEDKEAPKEGEAPAPRERIAPSQGAATDSELAIPKTGERRPGGGRRVMIADENGTAVVAKLMCEKGDTSIAILPSGRLKAVPTTKAPQTERPFAGMSPQDLLKQIQKDTFKDFKPAISDHYAYLYGSDEAFYQTTRGILETLYDGVIKGLDQWKLPHEKPETPLVILIFPDRKSFDAYHRMPDGVLAYYSPVDNFVVLYQDPELSDHAPEMALKFAAYTVAHEGVHQLLHNFGVQQRLAPWPEWVSEGLPELFCPIKISSSMVSKEGSSMPTRKARWTKLGLINDLRMYSLLHSQTSDGKAVEAVVSAPGLSANGYALAWGIGHYLMAKQPKQFREFLKDVSALEAVTADRGKHGDADKALFEKHFGKDFAKIENNVALYLNSPNMQKEYRDPKVYQTHYVVVHTAQRGKAALITVGITTSPGAAREWKTSEENRTNDYGIGAKHTFRTQVCETRREAEIMVSKLGKASH